MENSKLIVLRGNSGSGKTTIAKTLQKRFGPGTMLISQDVVRRDMLWVKDGSDTKALSLLLNLAQYGKRHCKIVILEGILKADWYNDLFLALRKEFDKDIYAYYFDIPFEETLTRHRMKPNCCDFGEGEMRQWWNEKDFLPIIREKIIGKELTEEVISNIIYNDITKIGGPYASHK